MISSKELLDQVLVERIGSVDTSTLQQIVDICRDAITAVLGSEIIDFASHDIGIAQRLVPWLWDLARGLHYQSVFGSEPPLTGSLVDQLSRVPLPIPYRKVLADRIDWAYVLTEDRIAQIIQGQGAICQDPIDTAAVVRCDHAAVSA